MLGKISKSDIDNSILFIAAKIKFACKKKNINKVSLLSSNLKNIEQDIQDKLQIAMKKMDIEVEIIGDVLQDIDAMCKLFDVGNCVLIEKTNVSNYNSVFDLVQLCQENEINNIGVIDIIK